MPEIRPVKHLCHAYAYYTIRWDKSKFSQFIVTKVSICIGWADIIQTSNYRGCWKGMIKLMTVKTPPSNWVLHGWDSNYYNFICSYCWNLKILIKSKIHMGSDDIQGIQLEVCLVFLRVLLSFNILGSLGGGGKARRGGGVRELAHGHCPF